MADREVQKRLAAILAADVAGYTRLMEDDTDGTVAAWHKARAEVIDPDIAKRNGRIVKHTGAGFLYEVPTVQEAGEWPVTLQTGPATSTVVISPTAFSSNVGKVPTTLSAKPTV